MSPKEKKQKAQIAALRSKGATVILNSVPRATDEGWLPVDAVHDTEIAVLRRMRPLVSSQDGNIFPVANPSVSAVGFAKELAENTATRQSDFFEEPSVTVESAVAQRLATTHLFEVSGDAIEKVINGDVFDLEGLERLAADHHVIFGEVLKHICDSRGKVAEVQSGGDYFTIGGKAKSLITKLLSTERFEARGSVRGFEVGGPRGSTVDLDLLFSRTAQSQPSLDGRPCQVEVLIDAPQPHTALKLLVVSWIAAEEVELTLARVAHFACNWQGYTITEVRAGSKTLALWSSILGS